MLLEYDKSSKLLDDLSQLFRHGFFVLEFNVLFVFEFFLVIGIKFKYRNSKFEIKSKSS